MKSKILLSLLVSLAIASFSWAQVDASVDTIYIDGGSLSAGGNEGAFETTINGDTTGSGERINPNRVYALYEGQVYFQLGPINVYDPTGMLTICGVPDPNNPSANAKPIIIITPTGGTPVVINGGGVGVVYGSVKFDNVYYQTQQIDGTTQNELFYLGTANELPQELIVNNCVFEFANIDIFDATNETGAIGGWPNGAKIFLTNSYFRNLFHADQWWGGRVFQCKHPVDTCWIENCTVTDGGLTFLAQNELYDFVYVNHNTIVNNYKYWMLSPYRHWQYITNNIFINQNWVGEDVNVTNSGQDPDRLYMSTIDIDTNSINPGAGGLDSLGVQTKYFVNGDPATGQLVSDLDFTHMKIFISNNINYNDPLIASGYYDNPTYVNDTVGSPPSYLTWSTPGGPAKMIGNLPGEWMNSRTQNLFDTYKPPNGGFVEENTITDDPQTVTPGVADASVVTLMAEWNQNKWTDPRFPNIPPITDSKFIFGDYDPQTLPGIDNGTKTDGINSDGAGIQVGISKFTDFQEDFSQTAHISTIDNLPIGSLQWNDSQLNNFNSADDWQMVVNAYEKAVDVNETGSGLPLTYKLSQNYPNPFNPTTTIDFSLPKTQNVTLKVYNILGQQVASLINGNMTAGYHSIRFDASNLSSGMYIYKISAGSFTSAKKMMLLK